MSMHHSPIELRNYKYFVKTYDHITPHGLYFHLCLYEGVCCVMVQDVYDNTYFELQYFTDVNKALRFINNL